ncbi:CDP-glucose 4,6-dehydratase [Clostridium botulinum]|uniref:CDP-glucose 4,6-dehydratase n=1 Tax=Clostridium botulinum TaxID=1491 RepID=UPI0013FEB108|nr:CDP-glucose 4,6-dehydratase [Clostridium botulinum]MBN1073457.1 CDP-glucose 4,6-dehydratase [Clostridium botulinum]NFN14991.1 CDP-glucose 4,6-dehydratase [Clostridium botulinum]
MFNNIYKGKRVFITGHTGFKGTWLTLWLKQLGAEILGYSLEPNTEPSMFNLCNTKDNIRHIIGDIRNHEKLEKVMKEFKPDIIFHLAAQPLVRSSYADPKLTYETNVIGTLNVYEAARKCNSVQVIVCITTDKCYENKEWSYGYRENDPMGGYDPYSSSKGCVELLTTSYRNSFFNDLGIEIASARAGNVIGGGDWAVDRLIPDLVKSVSKDETLIIRNPIAIRPWQHVIEPLSGYLWLASLLLQHKEKYNCAWNFGSNTNDVLSVEEILNLSLEFFGKGNYCVDDLEHPHEANLLKLDISKAMLELKWKPVYNVSIAVEKTIEWYKEYYNNKLFDMENFTLNQIREYVEEAKKKNILWSVV